VPKSLQQPHPPIWVAARSPDTIGWALKRGYNLLTTPWRDPFSRIKKHHEQVMQIAAEVGVTKPPKLAVSRMTFVGATDGDALEAMADIQVSHRIFMRLFRNEATVKGGFTLPEPVDDEYSREQLMENLVAGSPATCVEKVRAYEQLGISQFILYGAFGPDHSRTMASLRRFAEQVMPHFQKGSRA
jgi:alkanesulfonate monooxygenase SsuD/methylene tetrahydromethanopterin reductase-like flavin-dependent oxidoreductase (luciferase family)